MLPDNALVLAGDDPRDLADAIRHTSLLDPWACRRHVKTTFGVKQLGFRYQRIYRQVLGPMPHPGGLRETSTRRGTDRQITEMST